MWTWKENNKYNKSFVRYLPLSRVNKRSLDYRELIKYITHIFHFLSFEVRSRYCKRVLLIVLCVLVNNKEYLHTETPKSSRKLNFNTWVTRNKKNGFWEKYTLIEGIWNKELGDNRSTRKFASYGTYKSRGQRISFYVCSPKFH